MGRPSWLPSLELWWLLLDLQLPQSMYASLKKVFTTLSGGSLGSCVDEERSQLRELM